MLPLLGSDSCDPRPLLEVAKSARSAAPPTPRPPAPVVPLVDRRPGQITRRHHEALLHSSVGMATARSEDLRTLAQRVADDLAPELTDEVVLTGSVSHVMADDVSDIEMLVVTPEPLELQDYYLFES